MAIVVSHVANDFDRLARQALRQVPLADVVELRLDRIGDPGEDALRRVVAELQKPVIVSVHGPEAFGDFAGDVDERCEILRIAARAGARFVDVDWRLSLELGELEGKCHRIVSRHELEGMPGSAAELDALGEEVRDVLYEGDLIKVVCHAHDAVDGLRMLNWVRSVGGGLIGFASGAAGAFTRALAPIYGSPFTYAAPAVIPGEPEPEATAPGQLRVNELRGLLPPGGLSPETAIFAVVGNRVRASFSPRVHGMALKAARLDAIFVALETDDFDALMAECTDENVRGLSITAPFKQRALACAHTNDAAGERAGATNTLVRDPRGWSAFNTDVPAIRDVLTRALESRPGGASGLDTARVLVLGAGGAARAAATVARDAGAELVVAARRLEAAEALADAFGGRAIAWDRAGDVEPDVLVHATPIGSHGFDGAADGELPIAPEALRPNAVVLDAVYRPVKTPLLTAAVERGCLPLPGAEWFVRQAAAQFRLFTHQEPDEGLLRAAFEHALADG